MMEFTSKPWLLQVSKLKTRNQKLPSHKGARVILRPTMEESPGAAKVV